MASFDDLSDPYVLLKARKVGVLANSQLQGRQGHLLSLPLGLSRELSARDNAHAGHDDKILERRSLAGCQHSLRQLSYVYIRQSL